MTELEEPAELRGELKQITKRFDDMNARIGRLENRIDRLESKIDRVLYVTIAFGFAILIRSFF